MARRQTIPLADVRAPTYVDDQLTQVEVQQAAPKVETAQDLVSIIASQLRLAQGSRGWLQPPAPGVSAGTIDLRDTLIVGEILGGARDGVNRVYTTAGFYLASTISVRLNGMELTYGVDYVTLEGGGIGSGWDTIKLTAMPPAIGRDWLTASYIRAV